MSDIDKLVSVIRTSVDFNTSKLHLREKMHADLHLPYNGGLFKVTPELLAFLATWPVDELWLEDIYQNPIEVDKQVFLAQARQHYYRVMNEWHQQYEELKQTRKI